MDCGELSACCFTHHHGCRELQKLYVSKLEAGAFEPVRPRTTIEGQSEIRAMLRMVVTQVAGLIAGIAAQNAGTLVRPAAAVSFKEARAQQPSIAEIIAEGELSL